MSSSSFTVLTCDRCCHEAEIRQRADRQAWSVLQAAEPYRGDRQRTIGIGSNPVDLCPGCADELFAWWAPRDPVEQPVAAAAPAPAPRFTIEHKKIAIARATAALRAQVQQAFDAALAEPTSLLGGQILPGGLIGIDERAAALVDGIVAQLRASEQHQPAEEIA